MISCVMVASVLHAQCEHGIADDRQGGSTEEIPIKAGDKERHAARALNIRHSSDGAGMQVGSGP